MDDRSIVGCRGQPVSRRSAHCLRPAMLLRAGLLGGAAAHLAHGAKARAASCEAEDAAYHAGGAAATHLEPRLLRELRAGSTAFLQSAVDAGKQLEATTPSGQTMLSVASRHGLLPVVRWLADAGADVAASDSRGFSCVAYAAVVRDLLRFGAPAQMRDIYAAWPLSTICPPSPCRHPARSLWGALSPTRPASSGRWIWARGGGVRAARAGHVPAMAGTPHVSDCTFQMCLDHNPPWLFRLASVIHKPGNSRPRPELCGVHTQKPPISSAVSDSRPGAHPVGTQSVKN